MAGMVSFGHAAYLGIGSYAVGILSTYGITNGFVHFGAPIGASAAIALLIGFVSLRTSGVHFIMITLAFSQMIYFLCESLNQFGGDNGMNIPDHSSFGGLIDLDNPVTLYYLAFGCLLMCLLVWQPAWWNRASAWWCEARNRMSGGWQRWAFRRSAIG